MRTFSEHTSRRGVMAVRRVLSLWFPRMAAERVLRQRDRVQALPDPFAVVGERRQAQVLVSLSPLAEAAGLRQGQPLRDAMAMCPRLLTVFEHPPADEAFLQALRRWAGKFSPWVAEEPPDSLVIDLTGCAHLFGGEQALMAQIEEDCADLGLTMRAGIADTRGAAWALARYAGAASEPLHSGDDIQQEARATRSRAHPRRPIPPGPAPTIRSQGVIAAPGTMRQVMAPLPLAALRLTPQVVEQFARLGLRRVADVALLPRASLARRFGADVLRRLDQAHGLEPEPVSPAAAPLHFAVRMGFPDPIGLADDVLAGIDRLLPPLCARLKARGHGARQIRFEAQRTDGRTEWAVVNLARASADPDRLRPLLALKIEGLDAGFGFDRLRVEATMTEPLHAIQHRGHLDAAAEAVARAQSDTGFDDLIGKLGARLGQDAVIRLHPADSHIPEKTATVLSAAWSQPAPEPWPEPRAPRPVILFRPEPVTPQSNDPPPPGAPVPPAQFRWRRRSFSLRVAAGPERLLPEWWLDDPEWRSGARDYWRVEVEGGARYWLFYAHGGEISGGWFCQGIFA